MDQSRALVMQAAGPVQSVQEAVEKYQSLREFVNQILKQNTDYGVIPGTGEQAKKTLLKPGAEKLANFFGLVPSFTEIAVVEDWSGSQHDGEPFFYYKTLCQLYRGDTKISEQIASINSWETKFRWRNANLRCPKCGKETLFKSKKDPGYYCWAKQGGCAATFAPNDPQVVSQSRGRVKNEAIFDQVNTLQKQAQKRAFVGAVLIGVNASDYFTQDLDEAVDFDSHAAAAKPRVSAPSSVDQGTGEILSAPVEMDESNWSPVVETPAVPAPEPVVGEPYQDGPLTYRMLGEVKQVKWGEGWKPAEASAKSLSDGQVEFILNLFKDKNGKPNTYEATGHLKKHFQVTESRSLTWEQVAALVSFKKSGKPHERWYPEEFAKANAGPKVSEPAAAPSARPKSGPDFGEVRAYLGLTESSLKDEDPQSVKAFLEDAAQVDLPKVVGPLLAAGIDINAPGGFAPYSVLVSLVAAGMEVGSEDFGLMVDNVIGTATSDPNNH